MNEYEANLPLDKKQDDIYVKTKNDLEEKLVEKIEGMIFRSRVRWFELGEKNTKYFFSLEKARYNAKTCFKLINNEGLEITGDANILESQRQYYQELYSKDEFVKFDMQNTYGIKVPLDIKLQQDNQLTIDDLQEAVKSMNNNKTPGKDGIPVDFYKMFWGKLKNVFMDMTLSVYSLRKLHTTARQGILNLIPKPNKDSRYIKNLRPITLLNTDYKIIEKAIANKMIPALEHIIHTDQRGFMKDRRILVNIRKMLDIIYEVEKKDLEAVVLSMDFVKCFDKCSFDILHGSLEFFSFGQMVKDWTYILYDDFSVEIQNNGNFSTSIPIMKGVHQGGCCSSVYFLVIAEILAIALRSNEDIDGIDLYQIRNLLNQFADDMDVFSLASEKSIKTIFEELDRFRLQSGFTVSYDKTTLYRIGSLRHSDANLYDMTQFVWSNKDITVLGVTIAHEDLLHKNYNVIVQKVKNVLNAWYNRGLSLIGKIQVVNTLVASLFVYKMMVLPSIPKNIIRQVENEIRNFIWNGKKAKIAFNILQLPKKEGGLNLVSLEKKEKALKATWPQILHNEEEYSKVVYGIMRCTTLGQDIWRCNIYRGDVHSLNIRNEFWCQVLMSWSDYNYYINKRIDNQLLWYNSEIKISGKLVMWNDVYNRGLKYVYQLFSNKRFKSDREVFQEYGLTKMRFNSLKCAIPKEWKDFFIACSEMEYFPLPPHNYDTLVSDMITGWSRRVYKFLQDDVILVHNKYLKWSQELGVDLVESIVDYGKEHSALYRVTNITKYRSFQYRLLQRGLVTNVQLCRWKIIESELCSFCRMCTESLVHLFCRCPKVQLLWQKVFSYSEETYGIHIEDRSDVAIILNRVVERIGSLGNFICLITKQFIYSQRCLKEEINFPVLKSRINHIQMIEKYIAIKNSKLQCHVRKWGPVR